jgi:hypothetical protein
LNVYEAVLSMDSAIEEIPEENGVDIDVKMKLSVKYKFGEELEWGVSVFDELIGHTIG